MELQFEIEEGNFSKAGYASSKIKKTLKQLNIDAKSIKRIVVAVYEAEVNVVAHAYSALLKVEITDESIQIVLKDIGPGIEDIEKAMEIGFSTATVKVREMGFGAGMGLANIKKNTDEFEIFSTVGKGTILKLKNYF